MEDGQERGKRAQLPDERDRLKSVRINRYHGGESRPFDDVVAREEPLDILMNGEHLVSLMRLPGQDEELAAGYVLSEGLVEGLDAIESLRGGRAEDGRLRVDVRTTGPVTAELRGVPGLVSTGAGGADPSSEVDLPVVRVASGTEFAPEVILSVHDLLLEGQEVFRLTGATHGAGLFDSSGRMLAVREDVGRHNAVDKVLGGMLLAGERADDKGLILSGRLSYEMVLKAARAAIPLVCSVSAPTALGVEVGERCGVTLVGFLRSGGFNVYSYPERIGG